MRLAVTNRLLGRVVGVRPMTNEEIEDVRLLAVRAAKAIKEKQPLLGHAKISSYSDIRTALRTSREGQLRLHPRRGGPRRHVRDAARVRRRRVGHFRERPDHPPRRVLGRQHSEPVVGNSDLSSDVDRKAAVVYVGERPGDALAFREEPVVADLGRSPRSHFGELAQAMLAEYAPSSTSAPSGRCRQGDALRPPDLRPPLGPLVRRTTPRDPLGQRPGSQLQVTPFNSGHARPADPTRRRGGCFLLERQDVPTRLSSDDLPTAPLKDRPGERLTRYIAQEGGAKPAGQGDGSVASR
jgi:hypothetical protein